MDATTIDNQETVITAEQGERLIRAIAIWEAKKAALRAGVSPSELNSYTWHVDVNPL